MVAFAWILGGFICSLIFGSVASGIAQGKGYEDQEGFWWGFFLGVIGLLIVACKPDQHGYYYHQRESEDKKEQNSWTCVCGRKNADSMQYCTFCRRTKKESMEALGSENAVQDVGAASAGSTTPGPAGNVPLLTAVQNAADEKNAEQAAPIYGAAEEKPDGEKGRADTTVSAEAAAADEKTEEKRNDGAAYAASSPEDAEYAMEVIRRLGNLHEQGVLTDEEFKNKKTQLLKLL